MHKDRENYALLLDKYEGYLTVLRELLILRSQTTYGKPSENPDIRERLIEVRDRLYHSIEKQGETEDEMGDLQKLDILESRNVGIDDLRKRRQELEELQAEIESHPLFIKRGSGED